MHSSLISLPFVEEQINIFTFLIFCFEISNNISLYSSLSMESLLTWSHIITENQLCFIKNLVISFKQVKKEKRRLFFMREDNSSICSLAKSRYLHDSVMIF